MSTPPDGFEAKNISVEDLIERAYYLPKNQISGGPGWLDSNRYDIQAKMSDAQYQEMEKLDKSQQEYQFHLMLQSLLADRFQLTVSHHPRELRSYALVVARSGPKLHASGTPAPANPRRSNQSCGSFSGIVISQIDSPLSALAAFLAGQFGRPVIDQTGLPASTT